MVRFASDYGNTRMRRAHVTSIAITLLSAGAPACDGCQGKKPYTPYTLTDTPGAVSSSAEPDRSPDAGAADAGPAFAIVAATPAPGDGARWPLGGGAAEAPTGHAFAEGLVLDVDGDDKPDLLAWARSSDGMRGELWLAPGKSPSEGRLVTALPSDLAAPGCTARAALSLIGPRTAAFDFEPRCPARLRERATRWIAVLRLGPGAPEIATELRLGAPADGEALAVALDGRDRDGDGRGDVAVTFTLTGAPRPLPAGGSAAASIAFYDRGAGLSRDPTEPEASFKALGAGIIADGRKKTTAPRVPAAALAARRLHALLCEESGHSVISTTAGPVRCGDRRIAEESTIAEVEAALNLADPLAAFAALTRLDALGPRRKDVDALVAKSVPTVGGTLARTTAVIAESDGPAGLTPLAFDTNGDLLVRAPDRVVRVDKATFAESAVDPAPAWPKRIAWPPSGSPAWSLAAVEERCDAPTLIGRFTLGADTTTLALPIATPPRCTPSAGLRVDALGSSASGALFAVRGDVVSLPLQSPPKATVADALAAPFARGAARSPNGGVIAVATSRGVLVAVLKGSARGASAKLWTAPIIDGAFGCVPSDAADRLACVVRQGVAIYDAK